MRIIKFTAAFAAFFLFLLPCAYAQNYPLLSPEFIAEEEILNAEREAQRVRINIISMYWEGALPQKQIKAGEQIIITLRARNWYSQEPLPAFFMPPVPQGIILSSLDLSAKERADGIAVKFKIIPLAAGDVILPARTLIYENTQFQIPVLNIRANSK
jgi:hypothetical protein